ncbi:MAG: hypothetical protein ABRQ37_14165 [Candidatus Eremiobacterota bacterium]
MNTFRWNIAKKEQLGKLIDVFTDENSYQKELIEELLKCSARII